MTVHVSSAFPVLRITELAPPLWINHHPNPWVLSLRWYVNFFLQTSIWETITVRIGLQSSSVGYTIMGKTADLTVVQKTTTDTLHKEGKTQKVIAKEAGCSQSSVSKHINREAKGRKDVVEKKCTSNRDNRTLERICETKPIQKCGGDSQRVDCSWSQCFKNHYAQTYARHGFQLSHSLCQATLEQQTASEASRLG